VFGINMVALVDGQPRTLNLKQMLEYFLRHRRDVVTRRTISSCARPASVPTCWRAIRSRWPTSTRSSR
jgi:hypothetical protein